MNSATIERLTQYLSATEVRSDEDIGDVLGCRHSAVREYVEALRGLGVEIDTVAGEGYLLRDPLELLDETLILGTLDPVVRNKLQSLDIETSIDSTNSALKRLPETDQHAAVILAEHQSGGRGRRGRQWHSPYGRNLYMSMGWKFDQSLARIACLPLVVALGTAQALTRAGLTGHEVKWPNDLLLNGRKICGCLVEVQGDTHGPCHVVLGVGINVHMPVSVAETRIDQPWTDLRSQLPACSRNKLATLLVEELVGQLSLFADEGFTPFRELWQKMDALHGKSIDVWTADSSVQGIAMGIDENGALRLDTGKEVLCLHSGEASLSNPNTA